MGVHRHSGSIGYDWMRGGWGDSRYKKLERERSQEEEDGHRRVDSCC